MSTTLSATKRSFQAAKFAHAIVINAVSGFPGDKATFQTSATDNHLLWHLGHLATNYNWFAAAIDGKPAGGSEADKKLFGMGSKPEANAGVYPPMAELRKRLDAGWQRFAAAAESLKDDDAAKPSLIESGGFLSDRLDAIDKCAWHDGWHAGQLSGLRKALGLKSVFG